MKRILLPILCVALFVVIGHSSVGQEWDAFENTRPVPSRFTADDFFRLDVSVVSRYVNRGMLIVDDPVAQPQASFYLGPISLSGWANFDLTNDNDNRGQFSEARYMADFTFDIAEAIQLYFGGIYYTYPQTPFIPDIPSQPRRHDTWEGYAGAAVDFFIKPSVTVFYDLKRARGAYVVGAVGIDLELTDELALFLSSSVGWGNSDYNEYYFGVDEKAFTDAAFTASVPIRLGDFFVITPFATFTTVVDTALRDVYRRNDNIVYGLMASIHF